LFQIPERPDFVSEEYSAVLKSNKQDQRTDTYHYLKRDVRPVTDAANSGLSKRHPTTFGVDVYCLR
jgi:hypothetical protein